MSEKKKVTLFLPEEELKAQAETKSSIFIDHLGVTYKNKSEMLKAWNADEGFFNECFGVTDDYFFGLVVNPFLSYYVGEKFFCAVTSCAANNVKFEDWLERVSSGWSPASASVHPSDVDEKVDYLKMLPDGTKYKSWAVAAKHSNTVSDKVVKKRLLAHWSFNDALEKPSSYIIGTSVYGSNGVLHSNKSVMFKNCGITQEHYDECMKFGLDRDLCLTGAYLKTPNTSSYTTISAVCGAYKINYMEYMALLKSLTDTLIEKLIVSGNSYIKAANNVLSAKNVLNSKSNNVVADKVVSEEKVVEVKTPEDKVPVASDRTDHKGIVHNSLMAMCKSWGVPKATYYSRKNKGWSMEGRLTGIEPVVTVNETEDSDSSEFKKAVGVVVKPSKPVVIPPVEPVIPVKPVEPVVRSKEGQSMLDDEQVAERLLECNIKAGVLTRRAYEYRVANGMSLFEAATIRPHDYKNNYDVKDHVGNCFRDKQSMLDYYSITETLYKTRMSKGYTESEALTTPFNNWSIIKELGYPLPKFLDHTGKVYRSLEDMCKYFLATPELYQKRMKMGYPKGLALTLPEGKKYSDEFSIISMLDDIVL